ncbi:MAG: polysaccharide biosynthesis C-terminal domain-containing protein, partial [Myxococcota bacterium]
VRGFDGPDAAGIYYNAAALGYVPSYALGAANAVIMPKVARAWAEGRVDDVHAVLGRSLQFALLGAAPAIVGVMVAYRVAVGFGWAFAEGTPILGVLMVGQAINVACGSVGVTLLMCGYERLVAGSYAVSLAVNTIVSMLLVPILGPLGAAVGTALALSIWNLWLVANLRARIGVDTSVLRFGLGRPVLSAPGPNRSS